MSESSDPAPHRWKPGQSGNPRGRPKGVGNRKVADLLQENGEEIVKMLVQKAKEGDVSAAAICMARLQPPLRARAERVEFTLDTTGSLSMQAAQVLEAMSRGEIGVDEGKLLIECISAFVGLREAEEFQQRLAELEARSVGTLPVEQSKVYAGFISDMRRQFGLPCDEPNEAQP